jgi:hypothetical protein
LSAAPNQVAVMCIYGALAALRLTTSHQRLSLEKTADQKLTLSSCRSLAKALIEAGTTPKHRNSAAASYGVYLQGILSLWESNVVQATPSIDPSASKVESEQQVEGSLAPIAGSTDQDVDGKSKKEQQQQQQNDAVVPRVDQVTLLVEDGHSKSIVSSSEGQIPLVTPSKEISPSFQQHSVGDEIWGNSFSHAEAIVPPASGMVSSDPEAIDRMWDYLTTYPDPSSGFPLSLWQPHSTWTGPVTARTPNVAPTTL